MSFRRELLRALPPGYSLGFPIAKGHEANAASHKVGGHGAHPYVLRPDGTPLRDYRGMPIKVACSPGAQSTLRVELSRIRRALAAQEGKS